MPGVFVKGKKEITPPQNGKAWKSDPRTSKPVELSGRFLQRACTELPPCPPCGQGSPGTGALGAQGSSLPQLHRPEGRPPGRRWGESLSGPAGEQPGCLGTGGVLRRQGTRQGQTRVGHGPNQGHPGSSPQPFFIRKPQWLGRAWSRSRVES